MSEQCGNCYYWRANKGAVGQDLGDGWCHFEQPRSPGGDDPTQGGWWRWPPTDETDWCGKWGDKDWKKKHEECSEPSPKTSLEGKLRVARNRLDRAYQERDRAEGQRNLLYSAMEDIQHALDKLKEPAEEQATRVSFECVPGDGPAGLKKTPEQPFTADDAHHAETGQ